MPRLISSLWRSVRSPVSRSVKVDFPWSTCPTTPMLTSGWPGTFIAPAPATLGDRLSPGLGRPQVPPEGGPGKPVSADRLLLSDSPAARVGPDPPPDPEGPPPGPPPGG